MAYLISLANYKTWSGITGAAQDAVLNLVLGLASADIRKACDRDDTNGFESAARTEYYNGADVHTLILKENPITAIASVGWLDASNVETVLEATEYTYDAKAGILALRDPSSSRFTGSPISGYEMQAGYGGWIESPSFESGVRNYKVVYTAGYAAIPEGLQLACLRYVDILYSQRGSDITKTSESLGQYSVTRQLMAYGKTGLPMGPLEMIMQSLKPYLRYGGAR